MIAFDSHRIVTKEAMRIALEAANTTGAPQLPAIILAADGHVDLTFLRNSAAPLPKHVPKFGRPHLVIVGDDPGTGHGVSLGPVGWACARALQYFRPKAAIVHATEGTRLSYLEAAEGACAAGRLLMIECGTATALSWFGLVSAWCPTMTLWPTDGVHPVQEPKH